GVLPDGRTTVSRCFLAHQMAYQIVIIGGKEPVEEDPDFDAIMDGFAFTVPPVAPPATSYNFDFGALVGLLVSRLLAAFLFRSIRASIRPPRPMPRPSLDDDEGDVVPEALPASPGHTGIRTAPPEYARLRPARRAVEESGAPRRRPADTPGAGECRHCGYRPV